MSQEQNKRNRSKNHPEIPSGKLSSILNDHPFEVPESFFANQQQEILSKIKSESKSSARPGVLRKIREPKYYLPLLGAAASILVLLSVFLNPVGDEVDFMDEITLEVLLEENPELLHDLGETELISILFSEMDVDATPQFYNPEDIDSSLSDESVIEYLLDTGYEQEKIYN